MMILFFLLSCSGFANYLDISASVGGLEVNLLKSFIHVASMMGSTRRMYFILNAKIGLMVVGFYHFT